jgi:hypothetical protein
MIHIVFNLSSDILIMLDMEKKIFYPPADDEFECYCDSNNMDYVNVKNIIIGFKPEFTPIFDNYTIIRITVSNKNIQSKL